MTGVTSTFSPHDWVARQKRHVAELRERVSATGIAPGGWAIRAQRHEAFAAPPARTWSPSEGGCAPEEIALAFLAPPPAPPGPMSLDSTVAANLPTHILASLAQGALPFQQAAVVEHPKRAAIDLAVLLPHRPPTDAMDFFGYVGVEFLWFDEALSRIEGKVSLGRKR